MRQRQAGRHRPMKFIGALAFMAAIASASNGAQAETQATPEERALLARPDFQAWLTEVGVGARIIGQCERYIDRNDADRYVGDLASLDFDDKPGASEFEASIHRLLLNSYAEGRKAGPTSELNAAACSRLIDEHEALRAKAGALTRQERPNP